MRSLAEITTEDPTVTEDIYLPTLQVPYYQYAARILNVQTGELRYELAMHDSQIDRQGNRLPQNRVRLQVLGSWVLAHVPELRDLHAEAFAHMLNGPSAIAYERVDVHQQDGQQSTTRRIVLRMSCRKDEVAWNGTIDSVCWCCGEEGVPGPPPSIYPTLD